MTTDEFNYKGTGRPRPQVQVDTRWLDQIVAAHQTATEASAAIGRLAVLKNYADDESRMYDELIAPVLERDGLRHRVHALRTRLSTLQSEISVASAMAYEVHDTIAALEELAAAANATREATEALIADIEPEGGDK